MKWEDASKEVANESLADGSFIVIDAHELALVADVIEAARELAFGENIGRIRIRDALAALDAHTTKDKETK